MAIELDQKYDLKNINSILYTLAINLYYLDSEAIDPNEKSVLCLLTDRNTIRREYRSSRRVSGMTFYPIAFHPAYRNFISTGLLRFLNDHIFAIMKDNISFQNDGADVLSCNYF